MAKFLDHTTIRRELLGLFRTAEKFIFLGSPYIKLNEEMREALSHKKNDENLSIKVLFGKNEADKKSSLKEVDMVFFIEFKNVEIYYYADLLAKYYANEDKAIITSLNLHEYSLKNNIEIGVLVEQKLFDFGKESKIDNEAFDYFEKLFEKSEKIYVKKYNSTNYFFDF